MLLQNPATAWWWPQSQEKQWSTNLAYLYNFTIKPGLFLQNHVTKCLTDHMFPLTFWSLKEVQARTILASELPGMLPLPAQLMDSFP